MQVRSHIREPKKKYANPEDIVRNDVARQLVLACPSCHKLLALHKLLKVVHEKNATVTLSCLHERHCALSDGACSCLDAACRRLG